MEIKDLELTHEEIARFSHSAEVGGIQTLYHDTDAIARAQLAKALWGVADRLEKRAKEKALMLSKTQQSIAGGLFDEWSYWKVGLEDAGIERPEDKR